MKDIKRIKEMAKYCFNCSNKNCQKGCPLDNNIPDFINFMKDEKWQEAYDVICQTTALPSICGRVCPHEKNCEGKCIRGIKGEPVKIGELEAFLGDLANNGIIKTKSCNIKNNKKIAIVGGGPAGLTCAYFLAKEGYNVDIFEKEEKLGGILSYGIPYFRLDSKTVEKNLELILNIGIKVHTNVKIGENLELEKLRESYDAVFLALGANISSKLGIKGENLDGVFGANKLLSSKKHPAYLGKNICVIGGGNVAMDIARYAKKHGSSKVLIIYRRNEEQTPANRKEIEAAKNEGVEFLFQTNIIKIHGVQSVQEIECVRTDLVIEKDCKRPVPVDIEDTNFRIKTDYVIMAVGSRPEKRSIENRLETDENGYVKVDENYMTNIEGVFAGGDLIGGRAIISSASRSGRNASEAIKRYLQ